MTVKLGKALDHDFSHGVSWKPFIDRHDAEVLAEALFFYLHYLEKTDPMVNSVCSLVDHLFKECSVFGERFTRLEAGREVWHDE